jgi:hypothetical protein
MLQDMRDTERTTSKNSELNDAEYNSTTHATESRRSLGVADTRAVAGDVTARESINIGRFG